MHDTKPKSRPRAMGASRLLITGPSCSVPSAAEWRAMPAMCREGYQMYNHIGGSSWAAAQKSSPHLSRIVSGSTNECPNLTPSLVAHLFQCFDRMAPAMNPIIASTSIMTTIRTVSFQTYLLPPESRALALSIMALSSLVSFHEVILGEGPRPQSFWDQAFFVSREDVLRCGARRPAASRALHMEALKVAWDCGVILQVSKESAATCFLLDVLEQLDSCGPSRPWAAAYVSHLRALAPVWRTSVVSPPDGDRWAGYLMAEVLRATSNAFHVTCLARQLWETITGDHARLSHLSEGAVIQFLASLSIIHAILTRLLERADTVLASGSMNQGPFPNNEHFIVRNCALGIGLGFAAIALPLHREFEYRERNGSMDDGRHTQERLRLLRAQAREMAVLGAREFARALRYLPPVHYVPINLTAVRDYAQFALDEAEAALLVSPEQVRDLETIAGQLVLSGYSFDLFSSPQNASLLDRLEPYIRNVRRVQDSLDPGDMLGDMLLPLDQAWLDPASEVGTLGSESAPLQSLPHMWW
ncbi:hypothetical protein FB451DRAFT_1552387 [Mycena latifolia]|nr:hypothetical protein FB451DRAFT_1552387 [Mycena latifolia]